MRLFVAVELPNSIKKNLAGLQNKIKSENLVAAKFVRPENIHLTLKFLGEVGSEKTNSVKSALGKVRFKPFDIMLAGLGAFPSKNYVRVLFVRLRSGGEKLKSLLACIDSDMEKIGFAPEGKFESHATIARVKSVIKKDKLLAMFGEKNELGQFSVSGFSLIKSTLAKAGPVYEVIEKFGAE